MKPNCFHRLYTLQHSGWWTIKVGLWSKEDKKREKRSMLLLHSGIKLLGYCSLILLISATKSRKLWVGGIPWQEIHDKTKNCNKYVLIASTVAPLLDILYYTCGLCCTKWQVPSLSSFYIESILHRPSSRKTSLQYNVYQSVAPSNALFIPFQLHSAVLFVNHFHLFTSNRN